MAGDVVSAGTFVAAVLEQTGYLTQGEFLVAFKSFFRDAGALVYFFGAVGGLLSLVLFGSFRAARYLIFGPALYWALVGPTVEIGGVVAKLGGGEARGFHGDHGEAKAEQDRDAVLEKSGRTPSKAIKVAEGFWLFAHPINDFVNEFVDVMLKNEDGENLMVEHKVRGLELIARSLPQSPKAINMLEQELLVHCPRMYQSALGVAQNYIKARAVTGLKATAAPAADKYKQVAEAKRQEFIKEGNVDEMEINTTDAKELFQLIKDKKGGGKTAEAYEGDTPKSVISCTLAWDIFLEMIWNEAAKHMPNILQLTAGSWDGLEAKQKACEFLTSKLYDDQPVGKGGGPCDIQPGVTLALLANHLAYMDTFQRVLKRHANTQDPLNPKAHSSILASTTLMLAAQALPIPGVNTAVTVGTAVGKIANSVTYTDNNGSTYRLTDYAPAVVMNLIQGVNSTEQVGLPIYIMTQARKELYARAMHMPYYQGICLYLIAIAYPFLALLVLLPGKAHVFINVPLAWLWIKSWDIGFAAVILLERVMYNLLPNMSIAPPLRTKAAWDWKLLPVILGEGFNFNHVQNVAQYYTILAMATAGIPALTGVIVLKAKKAILGSFVGAIDTTSRDSGTREAGAYSMASSNERSELRSRIEGFARQQVIHGNGGVEGGLRGYLGQVRGAASFIANAPGLLPQAAAGAKSKAERLSKIAAMGGSLGRDYMEKYQKGVGEAAKFESDYRGQFDPMFGRWGMMQMYTDAYAAALDGAGTRLSGGFETNAAKGNVLEAQMAMIKDNVTNLIDLEGTRAQKIGELYGGSLNLQGNGVEKMLAGAYAGAYAKEAVEKMLGSEEGRQFNNNIFKQAFEFTSGGEGFEKGVAYQRLFGVSAETILDSYKQLTANDGTPQGIAEAKERLDKLMNQGGVAGQYFSFMYDKKVLDSMQEIPGGASEQHFFGFGGDRKIEKMQDDGTWKTISGGDINSEGFFSDKQKYAQGLNFFSLIGVPLDQNQIFMEQKIAVDNVIRSQDERGYVGRFFENAKYLENIDIKKYQTLEEENTGTKYTIEMPTSPDQVSNVMKREALELVEIAREIQKEQKVGKNFQLPNGIERLAETNPLLASEIVGNFVENLSQGQKARNANSDLFDEAEKGTPIFSTTEQARSRGR